MYENTLGGFLLSNSSNVASKRVTTPSAFSKLVQVMYPAYLGKSTLLPCLEIASYELHDLGRMVMQQSFCQYHLKTSIRTLAVTLSEGAAIHLVCIQLENGRELA